MAAIVAVFASVWRVRAARRRVRTVITEDILRDLVIKCLECPWLVGCLPTSDRRERRMARLRSPIASPGATIYRSDGASRGQGRGEQSEAGWGAACWMPTDSGIGEGAPFATCFGYLGPGISNNVAEYVGLSECLRRASRSMGPVVIFQVDSLLVARQMAPQDAWACRSPDLVPLRDQCRQLTQALTEAGVSWEVRHIFREYNQTADALANRAVDDRVQTSRSSAW